MALFDGLRRLIGARSHASASSLDGEFGRGLSKVATPILAPDPAEELRATLDRLAGGMERHLAREEDSWNQVRSALMPLERIGDALGELRRTSVTLNETLAEHADGTRRASESTQSLLERVGDSLVSQADVVAGMHQQVDGLVRSFGALGEDIDRLRASLTLIAENSGRSAATLSELIHEQSRRDTELVREIRGFRTVTAALLALVLLGVAGLAVGGFLLARSLAALTSGPG